MNLEGFFFRAIKKFTNAIKADPTYVKAYLCRAEAHTKIHDVSFSVLMSLLNDIFKIFSNNKFMLRNINDKKS